MNRTVLFAGTDLRGNLLCMCQRLPGGLFAPHGDLSCAALSPLKCDPTWGSGSEGPRCPPKIILPNRGAHLQTV